MFCLMPQRVLFLGCWLMIALNACRPAEKAAGPQSWALLEGDLAQAWRPAGIPEEGAVRLDAAELSVGIGLPMTGAKFTRWQEAGIPDTNFCIEYETMRVEGEDIFGMCTFPVGSHQAHATFVIGGWGGTLTGVSSINFKDASENQTRGEQMFENQRWYRVRLEVTPDVIRAWVDDKPVVNASIKGRHVSLRPGFIDHCLPFGFATWNTLAKIRHVVIRRL